MKVAIFFGTLFICALTYGQVAGTYHGRELHSIYTPSNSKKSFNIYNKKQITLNADSSFTFWGTYRTSNETCEGCIDTIKVTGKWTILNDTVYLNSKYNDSDYISVKEFSDSSLLTKIIYQTNWYCKYPCEVTLNSNINFKIFCKDTISFDRINVNSIFFEARIDGKELLYEFTYFPENTASNIFVILHPVNIIDKQNNSYISDKRFLLKDKRLIPIENNNIMKVENWYEKE